MAQAVLRSDISRRNPQDEYELIHRIGSGTYGDVYKVRDEETKAFVLKHAGFLCDLQAKRLDTNELAAIKVIKLEAGELEGPTGVNMFG